jgi:hypothetical protein
MNRSLFFPRKRDVHLSRKLVQERKLNPNPHGYGILRAPFLKTEISPA